MKLRIVEILLLFACVIALTSCAKESNAAIELEKLPKPALITNAAGSIEALEMQVHHRFHEQNDNWFNFDSAWFTLSHIWYDENGIAEQARFLGGGNGFSLRAPIVRGTLLATDNEYDDFTYLFVVDEAHRQYLPVFDVGHPEPYIFRILNINMAMGGEGLRSEFLFGFINLDGRRAYIRIVQIELFTDLQELNIIDGVFHYLEDLIPWRWR